MPRVLAIVGCAAKGQLAGLDDRANHRGLQELHLPGRGHHDLGRRSDVEYRDFRQSPDRG